MTDMNSLHEETRESWNENADHWDNRMGEGNDWHKILVEPTTERLLDLKPAEIVLDVACGNGQFSRKMAKLGARVFAFDFSEQLIQKAKSRTTESIERITYMALDASDSDKLMELGERRFDAAVCSMALMDMSDIEPLISALSRLLKDGGRFVFSVCHPCFNSGAFKKVMETEERNGKIVANYSIQVFSYREPLVTKGLAMIGQPAPTYYFHRPISMIFNTCFKQGFVLDGIEEPAFGEEGNDGSLSGNIYEDIPPVLVARVRLQFRRNVQ